MVILVINALTVSMVLSISFLFMNTINAQVYNSTTVQPQQQKYGAIIVFPLEPEPVKPYVPGEFSKWWKQEQAKIDAEREKENAYYRANNPDNVSKFNWLMNNLSAKTGLDSILPKFGTGDLRGTADTDYINDSGESALANKLGDYMTNNMFLGGGGGDRNNDENNNNIQQYEYKPENRTFEFDENGFIEKTFVDGVLEYSK